MATTWSPLFCAHSVHQINPALLSFLLDTSNATSLPLFLRQHTNNIQIKKLGLKYIKKKIRASSITTSTRLSTKQSFIASNVNVTHHVSSQPWPVWSSNVLVTTTHTAPKCASSSSAKMMIANSTSPSAFTLSYNNPP